MLSLDGIPLTRHPRLAFNTMYDISNSTFKARIVWHIHAVPDSGDLGHMSNLRQASLRTPDQ